MIKKWFEKIIPIRSIFPILCMLGINAFTYFGTRFFTSNKYHHILSSNLDDKIPFCSFFIYIYLLAFVQWIWGYILIAREDKSFCYRFMFGEIIAKLICLLCFVIYPTTIIRPEITGSHLCDILTNWIYSIDPPDNLFPSIHCLESYVCLRASFKMKNAPKWNLIFMIIMTPLVFASTVLLKQHVIVDMIGAVLAVEFGLGITGLIYRKKLKG